MPRPAAVAVAAAFAAAADDTPKFAFLNRDAGFYAHAAANRAHHSKLYKK